MLLLKARTCVSVITKCTCYKNNSYSIRQLSIFPWGKTKTEEVLDTTPLANTNLENFYLPEPPNAPDIIESLIEYNRLGEATFHSLGLNSYWPTGWMQSFFETMHVTFDIPWWGAIAISAICARAILIPITVHLRKINLAHSQITPELTRIEKKSKDSFLTNDYLTMMRAAQEHQKLIKDDKFQPYKIFFLTSLQFPIFLSVMIGLRQMANLPVASLQTGGLFWFTDLTMADPYYILPISTMILFWMQIEIGADFAINNTSTNSYKKWAIRALPAVGAIFTCNFPSALLLYWWCSSALSLVLAGTMKVPLVKRLCNIEDSVVTNLDTTGATGTTGSSSPFGFFGDWKQKSKEKKIYETATNIESINNENWIKAATEVVPKTFAYDPTKVRAAK